MSIRPVINDRLVRTCLILVMFVLYPISCLPLLFVEVYNRRYYSLILLAVFMGLLGFIWIPSGDLYRIREDFNQLRSDSLNVYFVRFNFDIIYSLIFFLFKKLGLRFAFIRLFLSTLSYLLIFYSIRLIISKNDKLESSKVLSFVFIVTVLLLCRFNGFITGVRFTFALAVFILGFTKIKLNVGATFGWSILIFCGLIHFSFWPIVILIYVSRLLKIGSIQSVVLVSLAFILSSFVIVNLIPVLPVSELLKARLTVYTSGFFAQKEYETMSFLFRISHFMAHLTLYPAFIYAVIREKKNNYYTEFFVLCVFLALVFNFNSVFNRYSIIAVFVFIITYFSLYNQDSYNWKWLMICAILTYGGSLRMVRRELSSGRQNEILTRSLPGLMQIEYDDNWVQKNIGKNGSLKRYNE